MATSAMDESTVNLSRKPKDTNVSHLRVSSLRHLQPTRLIGNIKAVESDLLRTLSVCLLCLDVWCLLRTTVKALVPSRWHYV